MKRFTTSLHDVAGDYESKSWIAPTLLEVEALRSSLKVLGFLFSEDEVPADALLFDLLVSNADRGIRTVYTFRTKAEVESIVADNLSGFTALPVFQAAALSEFLARADEATCFTFDDTDIELSVECMHSQSEVASDCPSP